MQVLFKCHACGVDLTTDTLADGACPHCRTQLMHLYKCHACHLIIHADDLNDGKCPVCSGAVVEMCPVDHCHCSHDIVESLAYCPVCGAAVCPACLCHDVSQISRITGYMSDVAGWNAAKSQELKDRTRYEVGR